MKIKPSKEPSARDSLEALLSRPALLKNERSKGYRQLYAAIKAELNPVNVFDEMRVKDIADAFWDELRYKKIKCALIDSSFLASLRTLLAAYFGEGTYAVGDTLENFYSGDPVKISSVQRLLDRIGVTPEQIEANGLHMRASTVQFLDRAIVGRATMRNAILKQFEKSLRNASKSKQRTAANDSTANHSDSATGKLKDKKNKEERTWRPKSKSRPTAPTPSEARAQKVTPGKLDLAVTRLSMGSLRSRAMIRRP